MRVEKEAPENKFYSVLSIVFPGQSPSSTTVVVTFVSSYVLVYVSSIFIRLDVT